MKKTNNWGINFPDNPYEGQIFYYPHTQDTFTYVVPKNQSGSGEFDYSPSYNEDVSGSHQIEEIELYEENIDNA